MNYCSFEGRVPSTQRIVNGQCFPHLFVFWQLYLDSSQPIDRIIGRGEGGVRPIPVYFTGSIRLYMRFACILAFMLGEEG
jgi:hypothetical protein